MFSIIIPTYNSERTIKKCLKSVIEQTFQLYEIIIIDGLSTDNTLNIVRSFNDLRIKAISEKDQGIYDAMNKGIALSNQRWIYFLGSDDILFNNSTLEEVSTVLNQTKNKIVYGNVLIDGHAGWATDQDIYDGKFSLEKLLKRNICHQSIFYKSDLLKKYSYNTTFKVCADYDLNLKLFARHHFHYTNITIANFKGGGKSIDLHDDNYDHLDAIIKYFYAQLYKRQFAFLQETVRKKALDSEVISKKIYLLLIYFRHRICKGNYGF